MHGHDGSSLRRDRGFDLGDVDIAGPGIAIHEHWSCSGQPDSFCRGKESVGGGDDLVARAEAESQKHEPQRVGAGVDAHGFLRFHVARQFFFKLDQLRAEHVTATFQHVKDGLIDFSLQIVILLHVTVEADV